MATTAAVRTSDNYSHDVPLGSGSTSFRPSSTSHSASDLFGPESHVDRESYQAITQRRAARVNAANIDEAEVLALENEHRALVLKKFEGDFGRAEQRRLNFVRWSLDRIQDARHGYALDELENAVEIYERVGRDIDRLVSQLNAYRQSGRRR